MAEPAAVTVRPGRSDDLPAVVAIERASFGDPWPEESLAVELRADALRHPLVATAAGRVVGFLMAWRAADEWHIINVAVDAAWRRRGVGARLLAASLAAARRHGCRLATLEVRAGNAGARAFYRRFGFRAVGVRPGYYRDTGEDAVLMTRPLTGDPAAAGPA